MCVCVWGGGGGVKIVRGGEGLRRGDEDRRKGARKRASGSSELGGGGGGEEVPNRKKACPAGLAAFFVQMQACLKASMQVSGFSRCPGFRIESLACGGT